MNSPLRTIHQKGINVTNYKVAIVGAGPAGYFTAQALQNA